MKLLLTILVVSVSLRGSFARADRIDDIVASAMKKRQIPGLSLAVIHDGKTVKLKAYGLANVEFNAAATTKTPFLLASITKTFTATSVMMLVEQGKVKLDDPLTAYLLDTPPAWKDITIRRLLSHTAGLRDRFEEFPWDFSKLKANYTTAEMYDSSRATPVDFKPGDRFQYSDQGYFLLGMVIEKASGETYGGFLKKHIFTPLGMSSSSTIRLPLIVKGLAAGYAVSNGVLYHNFRRADFDMTSYFGVISSVEDLAKWDAALYGETLVKHSTLEAMWTPAKLNGGDILYVPGLGAYGFGWFCDEFNGHRSIGHPGATGTMFLRYPDDKLTVIVLTNLEATSGTDAPGLARSIAEKYLPELRWSSMRVKPDPKPANRERLRAVMEGLAQGKADEGLFESIFFDRVKPQLNVHKAELAQRGPLQTVEFLESLRLGLGEVDRYRLEYKGTTQYATVGFDGQGRVNALSVDSD